jgi:hypothetical protein
MRMTAHHCHWRVSNAPLAVARFLPTLCIAEERKIEKEKERKRKERKRKKETRERKRRKRRKKKENVWDEIECVRLFDIEIESKFYLIK